MNKIRMFAFVAAVLITASLFRVMADAFTVPALSKNSNGAIWRAESRAE